MPTNDGLKKHLNQNRMTAKEKALELANKFVSKSVFDMTDEELKNERIRAKQCALIAVNEILESIDYWEIEEFYSAVKQEIENL